MPAVWVPMAATEKLATRPPVSVNEALLPLAVAPVAVIVRTPAEVSVTFSVRVPLLKVPEVAGEIVPASAVNETVPL